MPKKIIKTQSKAEKFSLVAGIIALITSMIQLATATFGIGVAGQQVTLSPLVITLVGFGIGYGWFLVSWFIIRRFFISQIESNLIPERKPPLDSLQESLYQLSSHYERDLLGEVQMEKKYRGSVYKTIIGIGIVLAPIGIVMTWYWVLIAPLIGLGIWLAVRFLMPIIYSDMYILGFD